MPFGPFSDILPKALLAAILCWAAANYFVIGPEIASRVARADHVPACEAQLRTAAVEKGQERIKALRAPEVDPAKELAITQFQHLQNSPFMTQLRELAGESGDMFGLGDIGELALGQYEAAKRTALEAHSRAVDLIKAETATELGKSGELCGCLADVAIASTRPEWAIFSGTLGFVRPAPLREFQEQMTQVRRAGSCRAGGSS